MNQSVFPWGPQPQFQDQDHLIQSLQGFSVYRVKILVIVIKLQMTSHTQVFPEGC